jgi:cell filamentation protein
MRTIDKAWAEAVTRLADDNLTTDATEDRWVEAVHTGKATGAELAYHLGLHLELAYAADLASSGNPRAACDGVFDPFGDFATAGYLQNTRRDHHPQIIKHLEHNLFRANANAAFAYLAKQSDITYTDFLAVHRILFVDYYPWAGRDRRDLFPWRMVSKGRITFAHPDDIQLAIGEGLRLGQTTSTLFNRSGEILGLFAYGHPFLDGNGRVMILIFEELSRRANLQINWQDMTTSDYLSALSYELNHPKFASMDNYIRRFIRKVT